MDLSEQPQGIGALACHPRPSGGLQRALRNLTRVRQSTHGRIRDLSVEEVQGRVVVRGHVPSHHMKQLALQGALEILPGDRFAAKITVGARPSDSAEGFFGVPIPAASFPDRSLPSA